ncbi:nucleoid-associated protein [Vibrio hyugaensis]|uniref:nucleoid-associated protein n=1 Tax=Vibrio hyugaensis TaxID=1534743 RepID=UPI0005ED8B1D|nr:nucleoid-associated protein [Vibrio hyugaensis]
MSLQLHHLALHQLIKQAQGELRLQLRSAPLEGDAHSEQLHQHFIQKPGKGYGLFQPGSDVHSGLLSYQQGQQTFHAFSCDCATKLHQELVKYPFADEGVLVMAHYQHLATEHLFIGLLPIQQSLKVTGSLDIRATDYLELNHITIAACINLSDLAHRLDSDRYLIYIKGRVGRGVSDFFLDFLQAEVGLDVKAQNQVLLQAVEDFCADHQLDKHESHHYRQQVFDHCSAQLKAGDEVVIRELSNALPASVDGQNFEAFTERQGYELDAQLLNERIFYDPDTDTLTMKGVPPNLRDQLMRRG